MIRINNYTVLHFEDLKIGEFFIIPELFPEVFMKIADEDAVTNAIELCKNSHTSRPVVFTGDTLVHVCELINLEVAVKS